jgi:hypothetical protein
MGRIRWCSSLEGESFHANPKKGKSPKARMMAGRETPNRRRRSDWVIKKSELIWVRCWFWNIFAVRLFFKVWWENDKNENESKINNFHNRFISIVEMNFVINIELNLFDFYNGPEFSKSKTWGYFLQITPGSVLSFQTRLFLWFLLFKNFHEKHFLYTWSKR